MIVSVAYVLPYLVVLIHEDLGGGGTHFSKCWQVKNLAFLKYFK